MSVPVLITPLEVEEERDILFYFKRKLQSDGQYKPWPAATYQCRMALDSAGNYPVATVDILLEDELLKLDIPAAQNKLKGSRKYYCDMVSVNDMGNTYTEFKFIFNCSYSI